MKKQTITLADFDDALRLLRETKTPYCLVGGLAVGLWSEELLTPEEKSAIELPIRSKDIDIRSGKEAAILSLVIPRFIRRALERHQMHQDPYHPGIDARRLAGFLTTEPWASLIPEPQRNTILDACALAD